MTGPGPGARRPRLLPLLLALAVLLGGCASIPTNGRVVAGEDISQQGARAALRVTAAGPAEGADERRIVEGFLAAVAGLDDYSVAREFLAPDALAWRPGDQTVVYEGPATFDPAVQGGDGATVTVRTTVVARIDEAGRYVEQPPTVEEQTFRLVQVDGEWRIAELPAGVLVSEVDAGRVLTPFGVHFVDPTGRYLVPDVRWFPQLTSSATSLVRALLGGPSAPYLGALDSAAPAGTRLDLPTVPVDNGVATVDLTEEVLAADRDERALLLAQLEQTLRAVPAVSRVVVTVDGAPLDEPEGLESVGAPSLTVDPSVRNVPLVLAPAPEQVPDVPAGEEEGDRDPTSDAEAEPEVGEGEQGPGAGEETDVEPAAPGSDPVGTPPVLALGDDGRPLAPPGSSVVALDGTESVVVPGTEPLAEVVATGLAVAQDGSTIAGLDDDRSSLWLQQPGAAPVELVVGEGLSTPSFDPPPLGWVWTVSDAPSGGGGTSTVLAATSSTEEDVEVEARWLAVGDEVRSLRVSRDGARVLLVVEHLDGSVDVEVRGIRRDATGRPLSLSQAAFTVAPELTDAVDAAWVSDDSVVVLGSVGQEAPRPVVALVGGTTDTLAPTPGAVTVSAGTGERNIVVGTVDGTVLRRSGGVWLDGPLGVSPAFPG